MHSLGSLLFAPDLVFLDFTEVFFLSLQELVLEIVHLAHQVFDALLGGVIDLGQALQAKTVLDFRTKSTSTKQVLHLDFCLLASDHIVLALNLLLLVREQVLHDRQV